MEKALPSDSLFATKSMDQHWFGRAAQCLWSTVSPGDCLPLL
jgi:hypothetical protein